jgi:L-cysteate sulfo-lyase
MISGHTPAAERVDLGAQGTPLLALDRLGAELGLGAGRLWVKREDLGGLAGGGNKFRKLEFELWRALREGADGVVIGGGAQSNAVRASAAAAARLGLACHAVLGGPAPERESGNLLLDRLLGARVEWLEAYDFERVEAAIQATCARLRAEGRRPYRLPIGVSTPLGAQGYVRCALELHGQLPEAGQWIVAAGSGGTQAGLLAGLALLRGSGQRVPELVGIDVGARPEVARAIDALAEGAAALAGAPAPAPARVLSGFVGPGYGAPTEALVEALRLCARLEGLLLDPVYTGKAMAGLIHLARRGELPPGPVVFLHTGGTPALFDPRFGPLALA